MVEILDPAQFSVCTIFSALRNEEVELTGPSGSFQPCFLGFHSLLPLGWNQYSGAWKEQRAVGRRKEEMLNDGGAPGT